jgi:hypothetical protein
LMMPELTMAAESPATRAGPASSSASSLSAGL